jgi:hypothetical protein
VRVTPAALSALCLTWLAAPSTAALAQTYEITAGASSVYDARGGSVQLFGANYQARVDAGYLDRPLFGFHFQGIVHGLVLGAGDENIPFPLPTDLFNSTYLMARGASVERKRKDSRAYVFAGVTSERFVLPFFNAARAETPAALVFYQRQLTPALKLLSQNMVSHRQTSIQTLQWAPAANTTIAAGGGVGNNGHYAASSLSMDRPWMALRAGYTFAGQRFGRIPIPGTSGAESEKDNALLRLQRRGRGQVTVSRQNLLAQIESVSTAPASLRARVNGISGSASPFPGVQVHASFFDSLSGRVGGPTFHSSGVTAGATANVGRFLDMQADAFESHTGRQITRVGMGTLRERLGSKLTLSQTLTRTPGGMTASYGGEIRGNLISVAVGSQMVFVPFSISGRAGFQQVLQVSARIRLPHDASLIVSTYVDALGRARLTAYGTAYAYGTALDPGAHPHEPVAHVRFEKYVVTGRVVDVDAKPVEGAAIRVGEDVVFTDSDGTFSSSQRRAQPAVVTVLLDQFMFDGKYEVVTAPAKAAPDVAAKAQSIAIVLRRVQ